MSLAFSHRTQNMLYKRVCRDCPISGCGGKYLVRLANHFADVHELDHIQRRQHLQKAKLQPKVAISKADNSRKNHYITTCNPVQTQETVYELSRSRRNKVSLKQKLNEKLQRTRQTARNTEGSRNVGLGLLEIV